MITLLRLCLGSVCASSRGTDNYKIDHDSFQSLTKHIFRQMSMLFRTMAVNKDVMTELVGLGTTEHSERSKTLLRYVTIYCLPLLTQDTS